MTTSNPTDGGMDAEVGRDIGGNLTKVGPGGSTGPITGTKVQGDQVQGDKINLNFNFMSPQEGALLRDAPTTAPLAAPVPGLPTGGTDVGGYAEIVAQALAGVRAAEQQGQSVEAVQAGDVRISKVELLLKRAVVVKAEAAQMMAENALAKQQELQALQFRFQGANRFDPAPMQQFQDEAQALMWRGFDRDAYTSKLSEARALFEEALALDETNVEALLQLADLLMGLTPEDVADEERVLVRVHALLSHPASDDERFMQAQALMLSAMSLQLRYQRTPPGPELLVAARNYQSMLTEARDQFVRLNRTMWADQANQMLEASRAVVAAWAGSQAPAPAATPAPGWGATQGWTPGAAPQYAPGAEGVFQPVGQWAVEVSMGGVPMQTAYIVFRPDQSFEVLASPSAAASQGRWAFFPANRQLSLQGIANGAIPYALQIQMMNAGPMGAVGIDTSGCMHRFTRVG